MIFFLSPAKNMRAAARKDLCLTRPRFLARTCELQHILCGKTPFALESVLHVNPALALRACAAFQDWTDEGGSAAALAFDGLAYKHLQAQTLSKDALDWAQDRMRLFSAFYGPLRPLDAIRPYRLELAHKLDGRTLYDFWGDAFYRDVFAGGEPVVNLASDEYARAVRTHLRPSDRLLTIRFLTYRKGKLCCLPAIAKMARGQMARFFIENAIDAPEQLPFFVWDGFRYEQGLSDNETLTFVQHG